MSTEDSGDIEAQLKKALEECASLGEENARLRELLEFIGYPSENLIPVPKPQRDSLIPKNQNTCSVTNQSSVEAKISLFRNLFRGQRTSMRSAGKERMEDPATFWPAEMSGSASSAVNRKSNVQTAKTEDYCL